MGELGAKARARGALLATAVTLAGCSAGGADSRPPGGQLFTAKQADRFVMHKGDFPPGYEKVGPQSGRVDCDSGYLANRGALAETEAEAAVKQQLLALGPQACNLSTYEITFGGGTTGFQALAVVFPDDNAASTALPLFRRSFVESSDLDAPLEDTASPALGDESIAGIRWKLPLPAPNRFTAVHVWRLGNVAVILQGTPSSERQVDVAEIGRSSPLERRRSNQRAVRLSCVGGSPHTTAEDSVGRRNWKGGGHRHGQHPGNHRADWRRGHPDRRGDRRS